ncbi:MAG: endonuclease domain-containing protein, partial [Xanthobacteraceae bacterium]
TDAEAKLWRHLRSRQLAGCKFVRQEPIGPYICDFVCRERRLVVEVDGSQHADSPADRTRDAWLASRRYRVLRFWNNEVLTNIEGGADGHSRGGRPIVPLTRLSRLRFAAAGSPPSPRKRGEGAPRPPQDTGRKCLISVVLRVVVVPGRSLRK